MNKVKSINFLTLHKAQWKDKVHLVNLNGKACTSSCCFMQGIINKDDSTKTTTKKNTSGSQSFKEKCSYPWPN